MDLDSTTGRAELAKFYRDALLTDVVPFWLRHSRDPEFGGYLTCLDRDGSILDTDKSIWFQGRGAWTFATLYRDVERRPEWLEAARSGIEFLRRHGRASDGKFYFSVTRDGRPLRMRRYAYSESFAAIASAAYAEATGDANSRDEAIACFDAYLRIAIEGDAEPKTDPATRVTVGLGPFMIAIVTAQELRARLGDVIVRGRTLTEWIDASADLVERLFLKPELEALLETVGPQGQILDGFDGRLLNPGHAIECAWFLMEEGRLRGIRRLIDLGLTVLDWMLKRGWDEEFGGLYYFRDLYGKPVQEYWHDMKFWWPHCEALIATLLAWNLTGESKYAERHEEIRQWSFSRFSDPEYGEWYGYLHRDGSVSVALKGNLWKGPFHLPRMLWRCWRLLEPLPPEPKAAP